MVAAGAAMATGGAVGRGAAADRATWDTGRRRALARGETALDHGTAKAPGAATLPRPVRDQRVGGRVERELVSRLAEERRERIGVEYRRIRIGGQRTLWGSCSPGGTLSFNWRLVLAPREVLDYVVVHELCHLRIPNHSRRFWALVERHRHWRQQRDWLRDYGTELLAFRPEAARHRLRQCAAL